MCVYKFEGAFLLYSLSVFFDYLCLQEFRGSLSYQSPGLFIHVLGSSCVVKEEHHAIIIVFIRIGSVKSMLITESNAIN